MEGKTSKLLYSSKDLNNHLNNKGRIKAGRIFCEYDAYYSTLRETEILLSVHINIYYLFQVFIV